MANPIPDFLPEHGLVSCSSVYGNDLGTADCIQALDRMPQGEQTHTYHVNEFSSQFTLPSFYSNGR